MFAFYVAVGDKQGVPRTVDFAKTPEDRQVMELVYGQGVIGRPYALPEGVPAERVAALRKAFMAALADPELLAEAAKMGLLAPAEHPFPASQLAAR